MQLVKSVDKSLGEDCVRSSRTTLRRINSKTMEMYSVGEIISQSYHLKMEELEHGFRDTCLHIQKANGLLNIDIFYPKDVIEMTKQLNRLRLEVGEKNMFLQNNLQNQQFIEQIEVVFYDVQIQTEHTSLFQQKVNQKPVQSQKQFTKEMDEYKQEIERLNEQIKSYLKKDKNKQIKNIKKQLEESQNKITDLLNNQITVKSQMIRKQQLIGKLTLQIEKYKIQVMQIEVLKIDNRKIVLENNSLSEQNNQLLEDVIHLEAEILKLNEQVSESNSTTKFSSLRSIELSRQIIEESVKQQKWSAKEQELHRQINDLKQTVNTTFGTNKTLKKQVSAFDTRVKELKKSIRDLKAKNKELRQHQSHEQEQDKLVDEEIVVENIIEYDVEIQTDLLSVEIDKAFQREVVVGSQQQQQQQQSSVQKNIKQLKQTNSHISKELKQKNHQINDLQKKNSELEQKIKHQKKVIQNINKEKKELYLQVHKTEESLNSNVEIEEVRIVEYEVEIQTEITSFNSQTNNPFTLLDKEISQFKITPPIISQLIISQPQQIKYIQIPVFVTQQILVIQQILVQPREIQKQIIDKSKYTVTPNQVQNTNNVEPTQVIVQKIIEKVIEKPVQKIVQKVVQKIIEKPVIQQKIVQKPVYRQKIIQKPVIQYVDREVIKQIQVPAAASIQKNEKNNSNNQSQPFQLQTLTKQHQQLKDLFDKVYNDNLVLIEFHQASKLDKLNIQQKSRLILHLQSRIQILQNQINNLKLQNSAFKQNSNSSLKSYDVMMNKYTQQIETFKKVNKQLQQSIKQISDEKHQVGEVQKKQIERLAQINQTILKDIQILEGKMQQIQNQNKKNIQQLSLTQKSLSEEKHKNIKLSQQNETFHRINSQLQTSNNNSISKSISNSLSLAQQNKLLRQYIESNKKPGIIHTFQDFVQTSQMNNLRNQLNTKQKIIIQHQNNINKLIVELRVVKEQAENFKRQEDVRRKRSEGDAAQSIYNVEHNTNIKIQQLNNEINNKTQMIEKLQSRLIEKQKSIVIMNESIKLLQDKSKSISSQHNVEIERLKSQLSNITIEFLKSKNLLNQSNKATLLFQKEKQALTSQILALRIELSHQKKQNCQGSKDQENRFTKLSQQYQKMSEKVLDLTSELERERSLLSKLRSQIQVSTHQISRLSHESRVNHSISNNQTVINSEEYQKVVQQLKASENVIIELKGIIAQYQQLIDEQEQEKGQDNSANSDYESILKDKIQEYQQLINSKIQYIDDLALKSRQIGPSEGMVDKLVRKLHKQKSKRQLLEQRVLKLGQSLVDYQKQIMQKTQKISYLNFLLLDLQDKSEMDITYEQNSLSQISKQYSQSMYRQSRESSMRDYQDYRHFSPQYRPRRYLGKSKYLNQNSRSRGLRNISYERNVLPNEFISGSYRNNKYEEEYQDAQMPSKNQLNQQYVSLKALVQDSEKLNPLTLVSIFLKVIEEVEVNSDKTMHLSSQNIFITQFDSQNPENISISIGECSTRRASNNLYESPQLIIENQFSVASIVWTLGIIFDELTHKSLFFNKMSAVVDPQNVYEFRQNSLDLQGLKKIICKMLIKDKAQRINLPNLLIAFKLEFEKVCRGLRMIV